MKYFERKIKPADESEEMNGFTVDYANITQELSNLERLPVYQKKYLGLTS